MFDEQPDGDLHGECALEIENLNYKIRLLEREVSSYKAQTSNPVAYEVKNGVARFQIWHEKEMADRVAAEQQKRHDLSGSLAAFHVVPLYEHPSNAAAQIAGLKSCLDQLHEQIAILETENAALESRKHETLLDAHARQVEQDCAEIDRAFAEAAPSQEPECQYAKDVAMPEYRCAGKCQYVAAPSQEPVAWYFKSNGRVVLTTCPEDVCKVEGKLPDWHPLYATPPDAAAQVSDLQKAFDAQCESADKLMDEVTKRDEKITKLEAALNKYSEDEVLCNTHIAKLEAQNAMMQASRSEQIAKLGKERDEYNAARLAVIAHRDAIWDECEKYRLLALEGTEWQKKYREQIAKLEKQRDEWHYEFNMVTTNLGNQVAKLEAERDDFRNKLQTLRAQMICESSK